jgi:polysaccharide biosynthesis transport protein
MSLLTPYNGEGILAYGETAQGRTGDAQTLSRVYSALRRRWRLFLAVAGGFVALVGFVTILTPKSYTTTVRLLAGRPDSNTAPQGGDTALPVLNALVLQSGEQSAETLAELAQQRDLATRVIAQLGLQTTPKGLLGRVSVQPVVNTALLNLSVSWNTPEKSAEIANAFSNAFVDQERDFVRSEAVAAIGFLSKELPNAEAQMRQTASRLAEFQSKNGYMDATAHEQDVVSHVDSVDQRIDQLTVDAREATALLGSVTGQLAASSSTVDSAQQVDQNPVTADLRAKLADVETQLSEAEQKYTPAHPAVIALRQQRAALLAQIAAQPTSVISQTTVAPNPLHQTLEQQAAGYRARIQGDQGQIKALESERSSYRPAVAAMPQQAMQFASIQEDAKRAANVYNALEQKYSDALVANTTAISDIIVVQPASADAAVKHPSLLTNLAIALAVGVLLGLAVVYALELIEQQKSDTDFARMLGLPVVARIPAFDAKNQRMLPWIQSMTVEAFLHLCVTLRLRNKNPVRTLAVLSARRGEGKSTVAYHLAKSLASLQPGVLLIDGDLRHPTLHEKANCPNDIGLGDVLADSATLDQAVVHLAPGLDVLTSRSDGSNPILLLQSGFERVLGRARERYGMVIVDAPALSAVSDGFIVAAQVDGSLLVVTANETEETGARKAIAQLGLIGVDNVLGVVVNKESVTPNDYDDYFAKMSGALTAGPA